MLGELFEGLRYVVHTDAAYCSIAITYQTMQNGKWEAQFVPGALKLIITDIANAFEEFGMVLKTEPPLGQIFEGSTVCFHCITQQFYYSNETWSFSHHFSRNRQIAK